MLQDKIVSIIIVNNGYGYTATMYFTDKRYDKIFSTNSKLPIYRLIENYIKTGKLSTKI